MDGAASTPRACPSSVPVPGAILLGVVDADGRVGYLTPALRIDQEFIDKASAGRPLGKRFRFAGRCVEGACAQWTGERCGVIDAAVEALPEATAGADAALPQCAIRSACRWWSQSGREACAVCPLVVTDRSGMPAS